MFWANVIGSNVILNVLSRTLEIMLAKREQGVSNQGLVFTSIKYTWKSSVIIKSYPYSSNQLSRLFGFTFSLVAINESRTSLFYLGIDICVEARFSGCIIFQGNFVRGTFQNQGKIIYCWIRIFHIPLNTFVLRRWWDA